MKRAHLKTNLQKANDLPWTSLAFGSCLDRARGVEEQILQSCRTNGFTDHDIFALKLALEEALVNACKHGNCMDPHKQIKVQYRITPQRADITIEDEGHGFNPGEVPDPTSPENLETCHGRGILLMRAYMSNVVFNPSGNRVTLTKFNESFAPD
ncbi:MAG: ATP-binding protein, partial [Phycisphaerae bacterium]